MSAPPELLSKGQFYGSSVRRRQILGFAITENVFTGGLTIPRHQHTLTHLTCVVAGGFTERYDEIELDCLAGSMLVVPKNRIHDDRIWPEGAETVSIEIGPKTLARLEDSASFLREPHVLRSALVARTIERIVLEFHRRDEAALLAVGSLALELLSIGERAYREPEPSADWMPDLLDILHRDPSQTVSSAAFAIQFGVSEATLTRTFRRLNGCSVGEYVRWLRLEHAKKLLSAPGCSIAEIAIQVGFYDQAHFSREFKKLYGISPSRYRSLMCAGDT